MSPVLDFIAVLPADIIGWMATPGHLMPVVDAVALAGCVAGWCMTKRAIRQRDAAERRVRVLLAERDERTRPRRPQSVPPHLRADVTVRIPVEHDVTRLDLGQFRLPTAQDMAAWSSRASGTKLTRGES